MTPPAKCQGCMFAWLHPSARCQGSIFATKVYVCLATPSHNVSHTVCVAHVGVILPGTLRELKNNDNQMRWALNRRSC